MCTLDNIIEKCKNGNNIAREQLYKMFSARMFAVSIQYSRNKTEAEDNFQDSFIKVFESIRQYTGKGSFEGWMRRIFINTALEKYRKEHPIQLVEEYPDVEVEDIDENINIPEDSLLEFISQLPEKYRLVFNLYAIEGCSHKEIAKQMGISEGTSKSNLARAREILKKKIKEYLDHEQ